MTDFAAAGSSEHARLSRRKRREVVVQVKALVAHKGGGVNAVAVQSSAQGNGRKRLRFSAGEQGTSVRTRKHVSLAPNRADFGSGSSVEALAVLKNLIPHRLVLYLVVVNLGE